MNLYSHISNKELPTLLRAAYEENGQNIEKASETLETLDLLLGVQDMKFLVDMRNRSAKTHRTRGRNFKRIIEGVILRNKTDLASVI